jgi:heme-degrading monooxygenase HmoA
MLCEGAQGHPGGWVWVGVEDAGRLFEEYRLRGARIRLPPTNFPWAFEMHIEDLDGNVLRLGSEPLPGQAFGEFPSGARAMIARQWHGRVPSEKAADYRAFLNARAVPDYRAVAGNLGVHVLERAEGAVTHFVMLTFWRDEDSIRAFAGQDIERPRYYPEDAGFLLEFEPTVVHYRLVGGAS